MNRYAHLVHDDTEVKVTLSADECAAVLKAYDYGLGGVVFLAGLGDGIDGASEERELNKVIAKLKEVIHP